MENIDPAEILKFEELAARWWDKNGTSKPLHDINPLRMSFIEQLSPVHGKKVIDIGCGGGILSESLARQGAVVTAIDAGTEVINVAKLHLHESQLNINYQCASAEHYAAQHTTPMQQFDIVTCMEMLEHVPDPSSVIQACHDLLKPGGHLYLSTLNRNPKSFLFAIIGAEYLLQMLPRGTHHYQRFIRPSELDHSARKSGLSLKKISGIQYNLLTKNFSLGNDVSVNYIVCYQKGSAH